MKGEPMSKKEEMLKNLSLEEQWNYWNEVRQNINRSIFWAKSSTFVSSTAVVATTVSLFLLPLTTGLLGALGASLSLTYLLVRRWSKKIAQKLEVYDKMEHILELDRLEQLGENIENVFEKEDDNKKIIKKVTHSKTKTHNKEDEQNR
jgi:preprotein translocase subunit SecE